MKTANIRERKTENKEEKKNNNKKIKERKKAVEGRVKDMIPRTRLTTSTSSPCPPDLTPAGMSQSQGGWLTEGRREGHSPLLITKCSWWWLRDKWPRGKKAALIKALSRKSWLEGTDETEYGNWAEKGLFCCCYVYSKGVSSRKKKKKTNEKILLLTAPTVVYMSPEEWPKNWSVPG